MPAGYSRRPRLDKLGVKPGMRVAVLGLADAGFQRELRTRTPDVSEGRVRPGSDLVFLALETPARLARLSALQRAIRPDGAIWVLWPRGRKQLAENMVRDAALERGLVDIKAAAFSEALSALKLVIPVARRPSKDRRPA